MYRLIRPAGIGKRAAMVKQVWLPWLMAGVVLAWLGVWLIHALSGSGTAAPEPELIVLRQASFIASDSATLPAVDAGWQAAVLPHRLAKPEGADLTSYWYKSVFTLPALGPLSNTDEPLWLYLPRLTGGGQVFVNDTLIASMQSADAGHQVRLFRPHLFLVPPSALRAGANDIALHFANRELHSSVSVMEIGPQPTVRTSFERRYFVETTTAEISTAVCLMAGLALLAFWLRRPQERLYGLFALALLFWGLRTLVMRWPVIPMAYLTEWRLAYYVTLGGFVATISIFALNFDGTRMPRLERFLVLYAVAGCLSFAVVGMPLRSVMDLYWMIGWFAPAIYCIAHLAVFAAGQRSRSSLAMGLALLLALGLCMHDFAVQEGWFGLIDIYLMHLGIPVFLLVMAGVLSERFLDSLLEVESANDRLALRVSERERELALSYERLSQLERVHGATEERQRIMQDMHDGVGSQLLTTMAIVERGSASRTHTMALLQECLDDMRLAIDSLAPDDPDLLPALGSFRFRMQARFTDAGIKLHWHNHDMPETLELGTHAGLQVLRILQESLANVLKHAHAVNVTVDLHFSPDRLVIRVGDDGVGCAGGGNQGGRGMPNMQNRAARIGAILTIEHLGAGTVVQLELPLVPATATRDDPLLQNI